MWFDPYDIGDRRIKDCSMSVPAFPVDIEKAPDKEGLYVLLDRDYHVLYIGSAGPGGLRAELQAKRGTRAAENVRWFLWVDTRNRMEARALLEDWVCKYSPLNSSGFLSAAEREPLITGKVLPFSRRRAGETLY